MLSLWPYLAAVLVGGAIAWLVFTYRLNKVERASQSFGTSVGASQSRKELVRFRAAVDASGDSIYISDRESMRFLDVTATACERTGYSRDEFLRMNPGQLIKGSTSGEVEKLF